MPELPEVQTVVDELNHIFQGKQLTHIEALTDRVFKNPENINSILNIEISQVTRRGKYIVFNFKGTETVLIAHLRMTGKFLHQPDDGDENYIRATITLNNNEVIYFVDVRQFGGFEVAGSVVTYFNDKLGVEPLSEQLTIEYLQARLNREQPIKNFLMDQQHIAGLGNIYADESLFLAKIHPNRPSKSLSSDEIKTLIKQIKHVLKQAIQNMGTSLTDYRNTDNVSGSNQNYLFVYGRKDRHCKVCTQTIEKIKLGGRGTHYCPDCQPA